MLSLRFVQNTTRGCDAQDARFALIYVIANVMYAVPGILIGYTLHHLGLAFTRLAGGLMVTGGFILLSLITQGEPDYLWAAVLLLSVGGNTMRMAGLQLADLFPSSGTTAMAIMSGIYTPSAGVMGLLQVMFEMDIAWQYCCWIMAAAAFFIVILTPLFPRHHVPYARLYEENTSGDEEQREEENENGETEGEEENNDNKNEKASIKSSLMSVSSFVYIYWLICNLLGVTLFSTLFNVWINKVATTREETSLYSKLYGWANIMCVAFLPLPGITIKLLDRAFTRGKSGLVALVASLQAMVGPMTVVSLSVTLQIAMMLFLSPWAIYVGLAALMINRTSVLAVGNPFVRVRFPAEHFNRLQGIQDTIISIFTLLQYPHFTWAQHNYPMAIGAMLLAMAVSIVQPLHLLFRQYLTRVLTSPGVITQL
ncbi:hypothetical protein Pcinc_037522 [Petrolisthes cinctipes]|uniref:Uncharacterized protein n=1 Tax=Petrolisthes cinctipes TaxID=88211 RepID=A0AAE1ELG3_PETCI|nr:hypothetical protein Pcinc_037522 [Petrolisthes cinctipes]